MESGYKVGEVMTQRPVVISKDATIQHVAEKMAKEHVGALLVTEGEVLKGIITEQDIVRKSLAMGKNPMDMSVADVMEDSLHTILPHEDVHTAFVKMSKANIRHLPVLENDELVGLITAKDVLKLEPQLFELMAHRIELKEQENKPIRKVGKNEGLCNVCGDYTDTLLDHEDLMYCEKCFIREMD